MWPRADSRALAPDPGPGAFKDLGSRQTAVIDVGSNSVRLVIYRLEGRAIWTVFNEKALAGLGRDLPATGRLSPDGIETALLAPTGEAWLDAPPEPLLRYGDGEARMALFSDDAWRRRYVSAESDPARLARMRDFFEARVRQLAAVLDAHGIAVTYVDCPDPKTARDALAA